MSAFPRACSAPRARAIGVAPSFFVIGAQKAGTTTLHHWLAAQPELGLPGIKETHFLSDPDRSALGEEWYASTFGAARHRPLLGEVDPEYLYRPSAARLIEDRWPEARLVVVLRNPLERARSHYEMTRARGLEPLGFEDALEAEGERLAAGGADGFEHRHRAYFLRSRYASHLAVYRELFPASSLSCVRFEDLFGASSLATFERLLRHIGARRPLVAPVGDRAHNARWSSRSRLLARALQEGSLARRGLSWLVPGRDLRMRLGTFLERINRRPAGVAQPMAPLSDRWRGAFAREVEAVERFTGWDLTDWYEGCL